jgi:hypothetical protein
MTSAALMLNIDLMTSASDWTSPVLLPLGPVTVLPIMAASMGFLVPFVFFIILFFVYIMWDVWFSNLKNSVGTEERFSVMRTPKSEYYTPNYPSNDTRFFSFGGTNQSQLQNQVSTG